MEDTKGATEDDPVVREVDVFLSQSTGAAELYLLQYPLCPAGRGYGDSAGADAEVPTARIKPRQQKIELRYPINTHASTYDQNRGSAIALATIKPDADPQSPDKNGMFQSGVMDCTTLGSSRVPLKANYMLGVLKEDGLYLNPLKGISQLRPSFSHLDEADKIQMEKDRKGSSAFEDEEEEEYKTTFKRRESERAIAARMRSHAHLQKQSDAEAWTALEYFAADSPEAVELRAKLAERGDAVFDFNSPHQWLSALTDETAAAGSASGADGGGARTADGGSAPLVPFSLVECMQLPAIEQVYKLMKEAQVMQFEELHEHVPSLEPASLVELLLTCACVIHGCWVVTSDRLFDAAADVDLDAKLRACRDHLLLALRAGEIISRAAIIKIFGLSDTQISTILKKIARRELVPGNLGQLSWVFIEDRDPDFELQYPRAIEQDEARWAELAVDNAVKTKQYRTRVNTREQANAMNQMKSSPMTKTNPNPEALLLQILDELPEADTFEGVGNSVRSRLEKMCTAGLSHYGVCSLSFLKGAVDTKRGRYEEAAAAESVWGNDISSQMIESALGAVNAVEVPVCDSGNAHPQRLYVYETLPGANTDLNKYRKIVLGLFGSSLRIKKSDILTACKDAGLPQIQQSSYLRIMHEIGESTANYWVLKAGNGATVRTSGAGGR